MLVVVLLWVSWPSLDLISLENLNFNVPRDGFSSLVNPPGQHLPRRIFTQLSHTECQQELRNIHWNLMDKLTEIQSNPRGLHRHSRYSWTWRDDTKAFGGYGKDIWFIYWTLTIQQRRGVGLVDLFRVGRITDDDGLMAKKCRVVIDIKKMARPQSCKSSGNLL